MTQTIEREQAVETVSSYREAYAKFRAWRPQTLQREGAQGMTFDYLPVPAYENFLDEIVGPEGWETPPIELGEKGVSVTLSILGVSKSSTSDIWPAAKVKRTSKNGDVNYVDNPQPNEVNKAEARAFRRAAAKHGLLRYLWDKHSDEAETEATERDAGRPDEEKVSQFKRPAQKQGPSGVAGGPSPKQVDLLKDLHVPTKVIKKLSPGRNNSASTLITDLLAIKRKEDDYDDEPLDYIASALKKIDRRLIPLLTQADDEDDEDEDED